MSEIIKASYMDNIREFTTKVSMGFYNNSAEDNGEVCINRAGWSLFEGDENNLPSVTAPQADWFYAKKNQVLSYGMPILKYAILDGYTTLDGSAKITDDSPSGIMGLWGDVCSNVVRNADNTINFDSPDSGTFANGSEPKLTVLYGEPRTLNQVLVQGCKMWRQFPIKYDVILYRAEKPNNVARARMITSLPVAIDKEGHKVIGVQSIEGDNKIITYHVSNGCAIEQMLFFLNNTENAESVQFNKMVLKIYKWSHPGAVVKLNYFSRDQNINLESNDIKSIDVFEEKSSSVDKLSYGISSNSCTILALDSAERFSNNKDLLKKHKVIEPSIAIKTNGLVTNADYKPLGKFYTDSWEMDSASKFVKCKCYDILYSLQDLMLTFPLDGNLTQGFSIKQNITAFDAFIYVFKKINQEKHNREIFGVDLDWSKIKAGEGTATQDDNGYIDPALKNITIPYLVLDNKSAWDVVQDLANFTLSNVYVNRLGKVVVSCDISSESGGSSLKTPTEGCKISPDNSFSYSMPMQSKTIVNKVTVPYKKLVAGDLKDDTIEVKKDKIETVAYTENGETKTKLVFSVAFKNFYPSISSIEITDDYDLDMANQVLGINIFYNKAIIEINNIAYKNLIKLSIKSSNIFLLQNEKHIYENLVNQKANGINEYNMAENTLCIDKTCSQSICNKIIAKYGKGVNYTETDWIGSPNLQLSNVVQCSNKYEKTEQGEYIQKSFECLSNEIKIDGGLRIRSKLRENPSG